MKIIPFFSKKIFIFQRNFLYFKEIFHNGKLSKSSEEKSSSKLRTFTPPQFGNAWLQTVAVDFEQIVVLHVLHI